MAEKPLTQEMLDRRSYGQGSRARFDPQWAMSRPEKWYTQSYDTGKSKIRNIDLIKDTLVRQPAVTTDPNESRNMYQMLMNQIRGGGGAQLIDTSGLPAGARRTGRTLFTDPAKSQGLLNDIGSLFTGRNKAAVRAPVHNVFGNFGQKGKDWYKKEFPISSGLGTLMEKAGSMIPYASWASKILPKRDKEIIPRDPRFSPENNMAPFWELLEDEVEDTPVYDDDEFILGDTLYPQYSDEPFDDITEKRVQEGVDEPVVSEIFENPEIFNKVYKFPYPTGFTNFPYGFDAPWNLFEAAKENMEEGEFTDQELLDSLVRTGYLVDNTLEEE